MIQLNKISKIYKSGRVDVSALKDVSLSIKEGEFVSIIGPSGSGKSTLLHILGLLDTPDEGNYFFNGVDVSSMDENERALLRNQVAGFVFQQFFLLPRFTAQENVEMPLIYNPRKSPRKKNEPEKHGDSFEYLRLVNLEDRAQHYPNELSGGQQQRVAIARSLINGPSVIFADEPTGNLDSKSGSDILALLRQLHQSGKTVIVITHDESIAKQADRVITILDGEIVSDTVSRSPNNFVVGRREKIWNQAKIQKKRDRFDISSVISRFKPPIGFREIKTFSFQSYRSITAHMARSFLSVLGILIGVASFISMLSIGTGASEEIEKNLESMGTNILMLMPGSHRTRHVALQAGSITRLTFRDAKAISDLAYIKGVSPTVRDRGQVIYRNKNWNTQIRGVGVQYSNLRLSSPVYGNFFTTDDVSRKQRVVVLGRTVVRELFDGKDPIGKTLKINRVPFRIIGVLPEMGSAFHEDRDDVVLIPITTAMYRVLGKKYIDSFDIGVIDQKYIDRAKEKINEIIRRNHRIKDSDEDSFSIMDMTEMRKTLENTTQTLSVMLSAVAAISLLVGGIGIMNIMLVTVQERTREIGLRKALGAGTHDILTQFLLESLLLSLIGGIIGIFIGIGISLAVSNFANWAIKITLVSILTSVSFSALIGIIFGMWPAVKAARLEPISALRYE